MSFTAICRPSTLSATIPMGLGANFGGGGASSIDPGDPVSHDDDSTYRNTSQPSRGDIWYCATGKPTVAVVEASTANIRFKAGTGSPIYSLSMYSAESAIGSAATQTATSSYANLAQTATPSMAQVNAATFGLGWYTNGENPVDTRLTSAWVSLVYYPPADSFISVMASVLGALGAGIGLEHMAGIAREVRRRGELLIPPEEYASVLAAHRDYRRSRFAFMAPPAMV